MAEFKTLNLAEIYGAADDAKMRQMQMQNYQLESQQRQRELQQQEAIRNAYAVNPDGSLDEKTTLSNLYRASPLDAYKFNQGQIANKQAQQKLDLESRKAANEERKSGLELRKEVYKYGRDRLAGVGDQAGYDALMGELSQLPGGQEIVGSMNPVFTPELKNQYLQTADNFIEQATPKYEKFDLGGKIQFVDTNPITNPAIKGTQFDKSLTPEAALSDERARTEGALNRAVTTRGQNITADNARLGRDVTMRGQNMTAATAEANRNKPAKTGLSPTAQKELFEADEIAQSSQNAIGMLKEALNLNKQAYSGIGAKQRAVIRSNLPGSTPEADATINLDNLMTGQALESLKATFGGMPTEGERKILLDIQASADKTPIQREQILNRAIQAAQKRLKFSKNKGDSLRSGTYFTEGVPVIESASPAQGGVVDFGSLK